MLKSVGLLLMWACMMAVPPAFCAEKPDASAGEPDGARFHERLSALRKESRARMQAYTLLSEVALFDEGAMQGRTVQPAPNDVAGNEVYRRQQVTVGNEHSGIGVCGAPVTPDGDIETIAQEIRRLERQFESRRSVAP